MDLPAACSQLINDSSQVLFVDAKIMLGIPIVRRIGNWKSSQLL
jgi:hypothetical protein